MRLKIGYLFLIALLLLENASCQEIPEPEVSVRRLRKQSEEDVLAARDGKLRNYLNFYGNINAVKETTWCPSICHNTSHIYESPDLSAYCVCNEQGTTTYYQCPENQLFNSTTRYCNHLQGNGYPTCIIKDKQCPNNKMGIEMHPNEDLYQNYIICLKNSVIVAKCNDGEYYNPKEHICVKEPKRKTVVSQTDCAEAASIQCESRGIFPMDNFIPYEETEDCTSNCYVICSAKNLTTWDLLVTCQSGDHMQRFYMEPAVFIPGDLETSPLHQMDHSKPSSVNVQIQTDEDIKYLQQVGGQIFQYVPPTSINTSSFHRLTPNRESYNQQIGIPTGYSFNQTNILTYPNRYNQSQHIQSTYPSLNNADIESLHPHRPETYSAVHDVPSGISYQISGNDLDHPSNTSNHRLPINGSSYTYGHHAGTFLGGNVDHSDSIHSVENSQTPKTDVGNVIEIDSQHSLDRIPTQSPTKSSSELSFSGETVVEPLPGNEPEAYEEPKPENLEITEPNKIDEKRVSQYSVEKTEDKITPTTHSSITVSDLPISGDKLEEVLPYNESETQDGLDENRPKNSEKMESNTINEEHVTKHSSGDRLEDNLPNNGSETNREPEPESSGKTEPNKIDGKRVTQQNLEETEVEITPTTHSPIKYTTDLSISADNFEDISPDNESYTHNESEANTPKNSEKIESNKMNDEHVTQPGSEETKDEVTLTTPSHIKSGTDLPISGDRLENSSPDNESKTNEEPENSEKTEQNKIDEKRVTQDKLEEPEGKITHSPTNYGTNLPISGDKLEETSPDSKSDTQQNLEETEVEITPTTHSPIKYTTDLSISVDNVEDISPDNESYTHNESEANTPKNSEKIESNKMNDEHVTQPGSEETKDEVTLTKPSHITSGTDLPISGDRLENSSPDNESKTNEEPANSEKTEQNQSDEKRVTQDRLEEPEGEITHSPTNYGTDLPISEDKLEETSPDSKSDTQQNLEETEVEITPTTHSPIKYTTDLSISVDNFEDISPDNESYTHNESEANTPKNSEKIESNKMNDEHVTQPGSEETKDEVTLTTPSHITSGTDLPISGDRLENSSPDNESKTNEEPENSEKTEQNQIDEKRVTQDRLEEPEGEITHSPTNYGTDLPISGDKLEKTSPDSKSDTRNESEANTPDNSDKIEANKINEEYVTQHGLEETNDEIKPTTHSGTYLPISGDMLENKSPDNESETNEEPENSEKTEQNKIDKKRVTQAMLEEPEAVITPTIHSPISYGTDLPISGGKLEETSLDNETEMPNESEANSPKNSEKIEANKINEEYVTQHGSEEIKDEITLTTYSDIKSGTDLPISGDRLENNSPDNQSETKEEPEPENLGKTRPNKTDEKLITQQHLEETEVEITPTTHSPDNESDMHNESEANTPNNSEKMNEEHVSQPSSEETKDESGTDLPILDRLENNSPDNESETNEEPEKSEKAEKNKIDDKRVTQDMLEQPEAEITPTAHSPSDYGTNLPISGDKLEEISPDNESDTHDEPEANTAKNSEETELNKINEEHVTQPGSEETKDEITPTTHSHIKPDTDLSISGDRLENNSPGNQSETNEEPEISDSSTTNNQMLWLQKSESPEKEDPDNISLMEDPTGYNPNYPKITENIQSTIQSQFHDPDLSILSSMPFSGDYENGAIAQDYISQHHQIINHHLPGLHETNFTQYGVQGGDRCRMPIDRSCAKEGFYRYKYSCKLHYECYYDKECGSLVASRLYGCPHCLQFNVELQRCDLAVNVPECNYHEEEEEDLDGYRVTVPLVRCTAPGIYKDPGNPKRYFKCTNIFNDGKFYLTLFNCPRGHIFHELSQTCLRTNEQIKMFRRVIEGRIHEIGSYAFDKYSCWRFYYYAPNTIVELHCQPGFIFNGRICEDIKTSTICNWEELKKYLYKKSN